ncbi:MAG: nitrilase-related carbon-nitrogen hydrolase [Armatimonadota bacterium]
MSEARGVQQRVKVAAVQCKWIMAHDVAEMEQRLSAMVEPAAARGAQLVVLPQYLGLTLTAAIGAGQDPAAVSWHDHGGALHQAYVAACARVAARYQVWLVPGTTIGPAPQGWILSALVCLFAPDGRLAGCQCQTHLGPREKHWGLSRGKSLEVFPTPLGRIGLLVQDDVRYPEVSRILALQGADILIHVAADPAPFIEESWLASLWREVQGNQVFGISSYLVGDLFGQQCAGRSALFAPVEMTEGQTGIVKQAQVTEAEGIVMGELDFVARRQVIKDYPIFKYFNDGLYARELPGAFSAVRR